MVRPIVAELRRRFEVAAAEAGHLDLHRRALRRGRGGRAPTGRTASRCSTRASGWSPAAPRSSCCRRRRQRTLTSTERDARDDGGRPAMAGRRRGRASWPTGSRSIVAETLEHAGQGPAAGFVTITDARVTGDLQRGDGLLHRATATTRERADTAAALESAKGVLRTEVGRQTGVRHTPSLAFVADAVPENAAHIEDLLARSPAADAEVHRGRRGRDVRRRRRPVPRPRRRRDEDDEDVDASDRRATRRDRRAAAADGAGGRRQARRAGPRTTSSPGYAGSPAPAASATPAPSTRWPPACWCSASAGPPGCSATSR